MDAIDGCIVAEHHRSSQDPWSNNYWDLDDAHGIAIYYPPTSGGWDYANYVTGGSWAYYGGFWSGKKYCMYGNTSGNYVLVDQGK